MLLKCLATSPEIKLCCVYDQLLMTQLNINKIITICMLSFMACKFHRSSYTVTENKYNKNLVHENLPFSKNLEL